MTNVLDTRTLLLVIVLVLVARAVILFHVWRETRGFRPVAYWAGGSALVAAGVLLLGLRDIAPPWLSVVVAQMLVLPGWILTNAGMVIAAGREPPWRTAGVLLGLTALGLVWFTFAAPDYLVRTTLVSVAQMLVDGYAAWICWRAPSGRRQTTLRILGTVAFLVAVSNGIKLVMSFQLELSSLFDSNLAFLQFAVISIVFSVASTALFVLLAAQGFRDQLEFVSAERERAAAALAESNERLETALKGAGDAVWEWNLETGAVTVTNRIYEILGYRPGEVGTHIRDWEALIHPEDLDRMHRYRQGYLEGEGTEFRNERRVRCRDGRWKWLLSRGTLKHDDTGRAVTMIGTWTDIDERKRVEVDQVHAVLEASADGMVIVGRDGRIGFANSRVEQLFGYGPGSLAGCEVEVLVPGQLRGGHDGKRQAYWTAANGDLTAAHRVRGRRVKALRADGTEFVVEVSLSPFRLQAEPVVIASIHDVSEQEAAERAIRELNDSLEMRVVERTRQLNEAKAAAEAANRAKGDFVANMSHEIRTPMNAVLGMAYLALRGETDPRQRDYLQKILRAGEHLLGIINDILDFSKIEAGRLEIEHMAFDLDDVLSNLRQLVGDKAVEKGLGLIFDIAPDVPRHLRGDPLRLGQILINFVNNAIKFTERGSVTLRAAIAERGETAHVIRFEVIDTGIGIDAAARARLFSPFQQADSSISRRFGGTGLGLTISRQLAEMMAGECGVESEPGRGSTFWFTVCVEIDGAWRAEGAAMRTLSRERATPLLCDRRVLLVEDNTFNQQVAQEILADVGIAVALAENGQEALDWIRRDSFDAVLMDMQMPVMDGLTATRAIRALPDFGSIPIIAMTANASREDEQRCRDAGMDDFISKPIRTGDLYARLVKWIGRNAAEAPLGMETAAVGEPVPPAVTGEPAGAGAPAASTAVDLGVLHLLGDGQPLRICRLATTFLNSAAEMTSQMQKALEAGDLVAASAVAHKMKSGARWVGAAALGDLCESLEAQRRGSDLEHARELGAEILVLYPAVRAEIAAEIDRLSGTA